MVVYITRADNFRCTSFIKNTYTSSLPVFGIKTATVSQIDMTSGSVFYNGSHYSHDEALEP